MDGSDVNPRICVIVKTRGYRYTKNISLDSEPNRYYFDENKEKFSNPWLLIPELTSLPLTLKAKKSTKIKFSVDKNCFQFFSLQITSMYFSH